jgi:translation initiation factor 1
MSAKKKNRPDDGVLVYSTGPDGAREFGPGGRAMDRSGSASLTDLPFPEQALAVKTEKRQHARVVTVVRGFSLTRPSLERLAGELKRRCGAGGTVEGATIVVQGDHVARMTRFLTELGFVVS